MSKTQIPTGGIADDAISEEHIDATVITASTALAATPADTDELLISDAGTIKRIDFSHLKSPLTLIKTENSTSSASAVNVESCFSTTYDTYLVLVYRLLTASDGDDLRLRFLTGTNTSIDATNYDYSSRYFDQDGSATSNTGNNASRFVLADSIDSPSANGGYDATMWFNLDKNNSSGCSGKYNGTANYADGSAINHSVYMGGIYQDATSSVSPTGLRFFCGTGNIASVKISVYGVTK